MNRFQIRHLLDTNPRAVEAGILRIYEGQTADEKSAGDTKHTNGVGFNYIDASYGSYLAQWVKSGKRLSGKHLDKARKMCKFYIRQLEEETVSRLAANTVHHSVGTLADISPFDMWSDAFEDVG